MSQGVYVVSKVRHAEQWKTMREHGFPIISSWIDDGGPEDIDFAEAWPRYLAEASSARVLLVHVQDSEELKGGLLEIGAGLAAGAFVIVAGDIPQLNTAILHDRIIKVDSLLEGVHLANQIMVEAEPEWTWQQIVGDWVIRCFGQRSFKSEFERALRVLEEAIELAQASNVTEDQVIKLVKHVFSRPIGEISQELAGLSMTLLALAESHGLDLAQIQRDEIDRVLSLPVEYFKERLQRKIAAGVAIGEED